MILYPPADIVRAYLIARGVGQRPPVTVNQWPISLDSMPDQANDNYITVYDTGADQDGRNFRDGGRVEHPTVQVRIRGKDDDTAKAKGREVQRELLRVGGRLGAFNMLGPYIVDVLVDNFPVPVVIKSAFALPLIPLKQEELNKRRVYVLNVRITTEE